MTDLHVIAVDPGGTTGWAAWFKGTVTWGQIPGGTVPGGTQLGQMIENMWVCSSWDDAAASVVVERYTIGERTVKYSRQADALKITGHLEVKAARWRIPFVLQQPKEAMRLFPDERLRQFGWYVPGQEHARDALRHLGLFLAKKRIIRLTSLETDGDEHG